MAHSPPTSVASHADGLRARHAFLPRGGTRDKPKNACVGGYPPVRPGFDSGNMWVEFVVGSHLTPCRIILRVLRFFLSPQKPSIPNSNSTSERGYPPVRPGFDSGNMWVEFVVGSHLTPCRIILRVLRFFLSPQKPSIPNSNSTRREDLRENRLRLLWLSL